MKNNPNADKAFLLDFFKGYGKNIVDALEARAQDMSIDELFENANFFPDFNPEKQYYNYKVGFVCRSPYGNLVRLLHQYDSLIYTSPPEDLSDYWENLGPIGGG